jgi:hypothetical protein
MQKRDFCLCLRSPSREKETYGKETSLEKETGEKETSVLFFLAEIPVIDFVFGHP